MANWPAYNAGSARITLRPKLADGFRAQVRALVKPINEQIKVQISPQLAPRFRTDLRNMVRTASQGITATVGVRVDTRTVRSQVRAATQNLPDARLRLDLDLRRAVSQLEAFRAQVAAQPLTLNVDADTSRAVAQLMALRTLATSVGEQINGINARGAAGGGGRGSRGGIFTRPIRAIRLQIELDRASVARAEAEVANVAERLSRARRQQADAADRVTLAEQRHAEVMARSNASTSQQIAATQALARARRSLADSQGRVSSLMNDEYNARNRLDRARSEQGGIGRLVGAGVSGLGSAIGDAARSMLSFRNLTQLATVALVALAAVSLVPLIGQLAQAAGVVGLFPAALAGAVSVFAAVKISLTGISDAFDAAGKAADSAGSDMEAQGKAVASAQKQVASAVKGVTSAERGVRNAQKQSLQAQKDLNRARKAAKDEIDDLNRALGRTTLTEQSAAIAVAEAQRALWETFADPNADAIDRARAQNNLGQALADQEDLLRENQNLAQRAAEANAAGVEGSDQVVAAKERVTEAAEAELDAQRALVDAQQTLVEAQQAVTEAMNEGSSAAKEFEKAMGKLSPNARQFVQDMLDLRPELGGLRRDLQDLFFLDLGGSVSNLARNWLGPLREGLGGITTEINAGIRRALADLDTDATRSKVSTLFDNVARSVGPVIDGIDDIVQGFLSLSQVGSEFLPGLSGGFADLAQRFRDWAESDEGQQKFRDFLRESIETFGKLWDIGTRVFDLVRNIFRGSDETGEGWLDSISKTLDRWNQFLGSEEGQQKIKDFFTDVRDTVNAITTMLSAAVGLIEKAEGSPLGKLVGAFTAEDKSLADRAKDVGGAIVDTSPIVTYGTPALDRAKEALGGFADWAGQKASEVGGWFSDMGTDISDFGQQSWDSITNWASKSFTDFKNSLPDVSSAVGTFKDEAGVKIDEFKDWVGDTFDTITGPDVLGKLRTAFNDLPGFFGGIIGGIGSKFGELPGKLTGPVNGMIDILNGFGDIWNKVATKLGLPQWEPIGHVGTQAQLGKAENKQPTPMVRWMGGPVKGGIPGRDSVPIMAMPDEHVLTTADVKAAGGHDAIFAWRRSLHNGGGTQASPDGPVGKYAEGGIVRTSDPLQPIQAHLWDLVRSAIPGAVLTSGQRFTDVGSGYDLHMQGKAIDLGGPMDEIARWIYNTYPQSAELIHWPLNGWQNLDEGKPFDFGPATNAAHTDHVHWGAHDFLTQLSEEEKNGLFDRVRAMAGSALGAGRDMAIDNLVRKPLNALVNQVPEFPGLGEFGKMPKAFVRKLADEVTAFISSRLGGSGGGLVDYEPSAGVEQWRNLAIEAMRRTGFNADDPNQVNAMLAQIQSESGGNPSILQQVQDVNSGGNEAQGLLQVIPGTFAAYRDPSLPNDRTDPLANMVAALNYYKARYGNDLTTEWGHGHGYANGGWVNGPGGPLSDKIRALLSNGEFVVRAGAAKHFGPLLEAINGGKVPQAQSLERVAPPPFDPNTPPYGGAQPPETNIWGGTPVAGVDTVSSLKQKTHDRFKGALETGFNDLVSSTLGPLGLPDPRTLIPSEVIDYGRTFDAWSKAKAQAAQFPADQSLAQSGYYQAGQHAIGAANTVMSSSQAGNTSMTTIDNSTTINISAADPSDALRKAELYREVRALQHTGTARG